MSKFLPIEKIKFPIYIRSGGNFFCSTLHMCLQNEIPSILLETQFKQKTVLDSKK